MNSKLLTDIITSPDSNNTITKSDLKKVFLRSIPMEFTWNYERQMSLGYCYAILHVLKKIYKNDPEKLNKETMDLYKQEKMSPFSGCFSAIIQFILLISIFYTK